MTCSGLGYSYVVFEASIGKEGMLVFVACGPRSLLLSFFGGRHGAERSVSPTSGIFMHHLVAGLSLARLTSLARVTLESGGESKAQKLKIADRSCDGSGHE